MGKANFSDEFKRDAATQITGRGYPVAKAAAHIGIVRRKSPKGRTVSDI